MLRLGLAVAAITLVADQVTKLYFYDLLVIGGVRFIEVLPFFNLVTVWNYGVSFGMLTNDSQIGPWLFVAVALAIVAALFTWLRRAATRMVAIALGMVIGGAIGNVIDRLTYGAVFDFLDLHAFGWHWPAFNLADSGISIGVILLLADGLLGDKRSTK
ncbi:MAG: signal peptidase II [Alphaproteobacteria bacterium]|nr:signal peptidase II [Alphaproteobacteria bacterium]